MVNGLSNASTEAELVASAIKECSEAHQAKLVGAPLQKLEKEIREAAIALFNMLPADAAGPLLASICDAKAAKRENSGHAV